MPNHSENFQYNSCTSKGICSVSPKTSALIVILIIYLRLTAKYCLRVCQNISIDNDIKELILKTIILAVTSQDISETDFMETVAEFKKFLPEIIKKCNSLFEDDDFKHEEITSSELFIQTETVLDSIKLGERVLRKTLSVISAEIRDLHMTAMVVAKSISINLIDLFDFTKNYDDGFDCILKLLNSIETCHPNSDILVSEIKTAVNINNELMTKLKTVQEERYGKQKISAVSYSTVPNKAILVAGSNIQELENVLEAFKDTNIDVYTHDDMMTAHTFPKFKEYKNLKGQFGQGLENCLIDFATFPGPIILTKHSLHNIDNLYRGHLFTTDFIIPKGVTKIHDNDYKEVIETALSSKGFKKGKTCETVTIGYDFEDTIELINSKISSGIKRIFLIGSENFSLELKTYFEKMIKYAPEDILIISFSYTAKRENFIHINTCFDTFGLVKIFNEIENCGLPITIFMPKCNRNTISEMIYASQKENTRVYVGNCTPILLNPSLLNTLKKIFNIKGITEVKNDLEDITGS